MAGSIGVGTVLKVPHCLCVRLFTSIPKPPVLGRTQSRAQVAPFSLGGGQRVRQ